MHKDQPGTQVPQGKIDPITSLRFFAALFVVVGHTVRPMTNWSWGPGLSFLDMGFSVSVSFFFLLSGYILAVVYLRGDRSLEKRRFYVARFARIYPLFLLTLILDTPALLFSRVHLYGWHSAVVKTTTTFVAHIFMLQAWIWRLRGIDSPNWSLSVETLFYVSFPFIGLMLWRLRGARLWLSAISIYLAGQVLVWVVAPHMVAVNAECFPVLHLSTFVVGILLARWQASRELGKNGASPRLGTIYAVLSVASLAYASLFFLPLPPSSNLSDGLLSPIFCAYIWAFSHSGTLVARLLSAKWLVLLGESSFALYLIHIPISHFLELFHPRPSPVIFLSYVAGCIALSILCFLYFESPSRKMVATWLSARDRVPVNAQGAHVA